MSKADKEIEFLFDMAEIKEAEEYYEVWIDNENHEGFGKEPLAITKNLNVAKVLRTSIEKLWKEECQIYLMCKEKGKRELLDIEG